MNNMSEELSAAVALTTLGVPSTSNRIMTPQVPLRPSLLAAQQQGFPPPRRIENNRRTKNQERIKTNTSSSRAVGLKRNFAEKLFDLLLETGFHSDIIKWLPGGKAFIVMDKRRFANEIMPTYFKESQYTSFTRKLSRWKFIRVSRGPYMGAYYHKHFRIDNRFLCKLMSCNNTSTSSKPNTNTDPEECSKGDKKQDQDTVLREISRTSPPPPPPEQQYAESVIEKAVALQNHMENNKREMFLIKQQLMTIRLRKARVEKKKQMLLMKAGTKHLKEIQRFKSAVNYLSIQQAEAAHIIAAATRALDRSHNLSHSIIPSHNNNGMCAWPSWVQDTNTFVTAPNSLKTNSLKKNQLLQNHHQGTNNYRLSRSNPNGPLAYAA